MEGVWRESGLHVQGMRVGECGESLASMYRAQEHIFHREPSSFSSRFSHAYSLLSCSAFCTFVSVHVRTRLTVRLAYDIFTLTTACIFTIACLFTTKLKVQPSLCERRCGQQLQPSCDVRGRERLPPLTAHW